MKKQTPSQEGGDFLPALTKVAQDDEVGTCPVCLQPARVSVHKRGGYYLACRHCAARLFTSGKNGTDLFRASQRVFRQEAVQEALRDALDVEIHLINKK